MKPMPRGWSKHSPFLHLLPFRFLKKEFMYSLFPPPFPLGSFNSSFSEGIGNEDKFEVHMLRWGMRVEKPGLFLRWQMENIWAAHLVPSGGRTFCFESPGFFGCWGVEQCCGYIQHLILWISRTGERWSSILYCGLAELGVGGLDKGEVGRQNWDLEQRANK